MDQECWGRFKYWVVLVDDYTRHSKVILLRHRDDLLEEIRRWHQQDLVSAGYKVGIFQCDGAGEQKSGPFDDFLTVIGTGVRYTNPYSSASNGIAERQIQKIGNTAHCIRVGARLPKAAWGECLLTAARVENTLPHRANPDSKSPYQMLTGKVPDVSYLRAVGAKCYVHVPGDTRKALDDKAQVGTMIGYATRTNGYRVLLNNSTGKIVESASVTFAETAKDMAEMLYSSGGTDPDADFSLPSEYFSPLVVGETRDTTYDKKTHPTIDPTMPPTIGNNVPTIDPTQPGVPMPAPPAALQTVPDDLAPAHNAGDAQMMGEGVPDDLAAILDPVVVFGFDPDAIPDVRRNAPRNRHPPERYTPATKMIRVVKMSEQAKKATLVRAATSQALGTKITNKEALEDPRIRDAMLKEIKHLFNIGAFTVTELTKGHSEITATWAHKLKYDANGQFIKAKSRITPRGFQQIAGESYDPEKVEAPTLRMETMSLCLALTVQRNMHVVMLDVDAAFTIPVNPYPTYMKPPLGIKLEKGQTLKIERALNGTMQSAYCWNEEIDGFLKSLGLSPTILDPCLYVRWKGEQLSMVALYVDDLRVMCDVKGEAEDIQKRLKEKYPIKITDTNQWLGMRVLHDCTEGTIRISQPAYIDSLLREYGMDAANPTQTPAEPNTKLLKSTSPPGSVNFPYRELVGNLLWLARTSRPDILYAVGQLCSHVINFDNSHVTAAKRVLRYLKGTKDLELVMRRQPQFTLEVYADADFAGEPEENDDAMKSLSGMVAYIKGVGPIFSQSKLQSTISTSTAEAEMKAVGSAVQFTLGVQQLLREIGFSPQLPTTIYNDNAACLASLKSSTSGSKLRHVKINFHFVKEKVREGLINLTYCPTGRMIADVMTKALPAPRFLQLRDLLLDGGAPAAVARRVLPRRSASALARPPIAALVRPRHSNSASSNPCVWCRPHGDHRGMGECRKMPPLPSTSAAASLFLASTYSRGKPGHGQKAYLMTS